jgi:hypothetical protein
MKTYEIEDYSGMKPIALMQDGSFINADTGRKALDKYLKEIGFKGKVKVSASNDVHFKVSPVVFEDGRKYFDYRNGQRSLWYQIQTN